MTLDFSQTYEAVRDWATARGITVQESDWSANKAGEFDGISVTMNARYTAEERTIYLAHALGSMVRWSLSLPQVQEMFNELRAAKKEKDSDPKRLEQAIAKYQAFEIESSEFAVWLLARLGHSHVIPHFTNFMRADLEALTQFHRSGRAPIWRDFFAEWNEQVNQGRRSIQPFAAKSIPAFHPKSIEKQEILQQQPP
jgi:hypothetical protein